MGQTVISLPMAVHAITRHVITTSESINPKSWAIIALSETWLSDGSCPQRRRPSIGCPMGENKSLVQVEIDPFWTMVVKKLTGTVVKSCVQSSSDNSKISYTYTSFIIKYER
jgi:hypothetical protein